MAKQVRVFIAAECEGCWRRKSFPTLDEARRWKDEHEADCMRCR